MIQAKCIQKFRNKSNKIIGYRLVDSKGQQKEMKPLELKTAIKEGNISVVNLTLTTNNRLIDSSVLDTKKQTHAKTASKAYNYEQNIKNIIAKAKLLGMNVKEIPTFCGHTCTLISRSDTYHIIYIPENVTALNDANDCTLEFTKNIQKLQGHIKVIGGSNIKNATSMFDECKAQSLDLSSFNTENVTDMSRMFWGFHAQSLDLSSFNTEKVTRMDNMFSYCEAQSIDLSSFNTKNVTSMFWMFKRCKVQSLDLSSFNTENVTDMTDMFARCKAQSINISSFNTEKVTDMEYMFDGCQVQSLDLSSFNTKNVTNMICMFRECQAQIKATDKKILEAYKNCKQQ